MAVVGGLVLLAGLVVCAVVYCQRCQRIARLRDATINRPDIRQIHVGAKACRMGSTTHAEAERMPTLIGNDEKV